MEKGKKYYLQDLCPPARKKMEKHIASEIGKKYGRLTVLNYEYTINHNAFYRFKCDCGNEYIASLRAVKEELKKHGNVGCGCLSKLFNKERCLTHGLSKSHLYRVRSTMKARCSQPNATGYKNYGGRGIQVCEEWLGTDGFTNFYNWAIKNGYKENFNDKGKNSISLDRIDNNGNYAPSNCRWVDAKTQNLNKRKKSEIYSYVIERHTSEKKWLNARGISATRASAILNVNRWQRPIDVRYDLKFNKDKKPIENEILEYGKKTEPLIRSIVRNNLKNYGIEIKNPGKYRIARRVDKPFLTCSYDGLIHIKKGTKNPYGLNGNGVLEIKTHIVRGKEDLEEWNGRLPQEYLAQALHYFIVMRDKEFVILIAKLRFEKTINDIWFLDKEEIRYYYILKKDFQTTINRLELAEIAFYERFIKGNEIPAF